jgi:large subunit ribosomal protein L9
MRRTLENVGKIGDIVDVSDGFGRNYLLPQRHAVPVTQDNRRRIEVEKVEYAKEQAAEKEAATILARSLEGVDIQISAKAQDDGTLYGSVSPKEIAEKLKSSRELVVDHKHVKLHEPIKKVGEHEAEIKLHSEVSAHIRIRVIAEASE